MKHRANDTFARHTDWVVDLKAGSLSISGDDHRSILSFDLEGRLIGATRGGRHLARGFDNEVVEQWWEGEGPARTRRTRDLPDEERRDFLVEAYALAGAVRRGLGEERFQLHGRHLPTESLAAEAEARLAQVSRWGLDELEEDAERFRELYGKISILPTDQYRSVVLNAVQGCPYNRCLFCDLYRRREFRALTVEEFQDHVRQVKQFLGRSIEIRKSIFLGEANALLIPQDLFVELFQIILKEFQVGDTQPKATPEGVSATGPPAFKGVYSFVDSFSARDKSAADYAEIARLGLRRAYLGLESGSDEVRRFLGKPGPPREVVDLVRAMKEGGLSVGIIILVGAGGVERAGVHLQETLAVLSALELGASDIVYLSPLVEPPDDGFLRRAAEEGLTPLSSSEIREEESQFRQALAEITGGDGPKVAPYDIRGFVY